MRQTLLFDFGTFVCALSNYFPVLPQRKSWMFWSQKVNIKRWAFILSFLYLLSEPLCYHEQPKLSFLI